MYQLAPKVFRAAFVDGLQDSDVQQSVSLSRPKTLEDALTCALKLPKKHQRVGAKGSPGAYNRRW